jgi:4-hydroxythreonine-4-phosphate dehydrogenase
MPISRSSEASQSGTLNRPAKRDWFMGKPHIIITMGDPSGVGPEVALKALASPKVKGLANFLLIGDRTVIERLKKDMGLVLKERLCDLSNVSKKRFAYGRRDAGLGRASMQYIDRALELLKKDQADALVTAPVNKSAIRLAGYRGFEGHTEYLAGKSGAKGFAMMFVGPRLKIALATRHVALKEVPAKLSVSGICRTIGLAHECMKKYFRIDDPKIAVAGLNPHAGESGAFGDEEDRIIIPAIKMALRSAKRIIGPLSPDAVFGPALAGRFDCVVAMYHDQALVPFKMLYLDRGVNLTLGLPFVRTSPDHGTAFDIAGKGIANPASMIEAIKLACRLSVYRPGRGVPHPA